MPINRRDGKPLRYCSDAECDRILFCKGLCKAHYERLRIAKAAGKPYKAGKIQIHSAQTDSSLSIYMQRDSEGRKRCAQCKQWRAESSFVQNKRNKDGLNTSCVICRGDYNLRHTYNISSQQLEQMHQRQRGLCAICQVKVLSKGVMIDGKYMRAANVDHDHDCCPRKNSCGKCVRGLLCNSCNTGLGMFKDSREVMTRAISYVSGEIDALIELK